MDAQENRDDPSESYTASERYFCPFPGCKRSFAELWRLKVHYRAPPDIRGSGKERGHGTELTHCPKCGKGLKPGKHHVGCSGGKTGTRQAKRQRSAVNPSMIPAEGVNGDPQGMYGMGMPGAYGTGMPNGSMANGYTQFNPAYGQQQYPAYPHQQQYQPDASGGYYQGQTHSMPGGMMQPQMQVPQSQPQQPGSFHSPTLGMEPMGAGNNAPQLMQAGSGEMLQSSQQHYQYQQQPPQMPMQQQPMMQVQQHQQHDMMQQQQVQQPGAMDMMGSHMQQQQQAMMLPQIKQEAAQVPPVGHMMTASGAYMAQQQPQQLAQQPGPFEQSYIGGQQAAVGIMPPPPPVPMGQMQQQQQQQQQPPTSTSSASEQLQQQMLPPAPVAPPQAAAAAPAPPAAQPPQAGQISSSLFDEIDNISAGAPAASAASEDAGSTRAPSPPPLPPDFPSSVAAHNFTLFNFSQFNQKLPAQQGPSQQMAMMPTGMERELPPSMDDLWAPEATYDHHSDGDLMQLLFGAPEQPPTMATIHLHHFLEDDACSSPLLGGLLGGSMDDLRAAEAKAGGAAAPAGAAAAVEAAAAGAGDVKPEPAAAAANGFMLPPAAVPGNQQQQEQPPPQQQQQHDATQPVNGGSVVMKHYAGLAPGNNGVIAAAQCGSSAVMHMQVHTETVQIKGEDGSCMLQQTAVTSLTEAVASRAT